MYDHILHQMRDKIRANEYIGPDHPTRTGPESNLMICDYCGKDGAKLRYKTQVCGPKNDKFLVDKVPVVRCPHCHQTYMTAQTAKTLDQLVQQRRELARPQTLDVIEFA